MTFIRSRSYRSARSYFFCQLVTDYFRAFGFYPSIRDCRALFAYASRKAYPHGLRPMTDAELIEHAED